MIRNPDMVVGTIEGEEVIKPNWYKAFLFGGTDSKITKHECLYEGKVAYEKLDNHDTKVYLINNEYIYPIW